MRAVKNESATRLAARRRHRDVAAMDGMFIGRALRFLRIMVNPFSVQIHFDETDATRGRHASVRACANAGVINRNNSYSD